MKKFLLLLWLPVCAFAAPAPTLVLHAPDLWVQGTPAEVTLEVKDLGPEQTIQVQLSGAGISPATLSRTGPGELVFSNLVFASRGRQELCARADGAEVRASLRIIHGFWTLLPPLLAIALALVFRQVLAALWVAIWLGAFIIYDWRPVTAVLRSIDHYLQNALAEPEDAAMLLFIIFMGGMIGMLSKSGGLQGVVELLARRATSARRGQLATWAMGWFIFFDDYANCILVGNTMRPITDRLRISREKLAYLVDTTAAPVASLVPISTWIGYEVGLINRALQSAGIDQSGYLVFLWSIPYRFYPFLSLFLVGIIALSRRDFGPMLTAERRARREGKVLRDGALPMASLEADLTEPPAGTPRRWFNAAVPLFAVIVLTGVGLWVNGVDHLGESGWKEVSARAQALGFWTGKVYLAGMVLSEAAANTVLCWSSLAGCLITILLIVPQRILSLAEAMHAWLAGVKSMVIAIVVLLFAWSLGAVCADLHTAEFLTHALAGALSPRLLPVLVFLIACAISFATGTSYGTMAILMPLVIPIGHRLALEAGFNPADQHLILVGVVSSVLAGAVFGDHCSPISDTTIMSSMAAACDHVDHVRTQLPYALLVALVGMLLGDIPTAYGMSPLLTLIGGSLVLFGVLRIFGRRVDETPAAGQE